MVALGNLESIMRALRGGQSSQGGPPPGSQPQLNQPQLQLPQLTQLPQFPQGMGQGVMPFIRDSTMANVLGPLQQPNYGIPFISPYRGGGMGTAPQAPSPIGPQLPPGLRIPPGQPGRPGFPGWPVGLGSAGLQLIRGGIY